MNGYIKIRLLNKLPTLEDVLTRSTGTMEKENFINIWMNDWENIMAHGLEVLRVGAKMVYAYVR